MKKVYVILLGMFLAFCGSAFAQDINDVSSEKWLDHVSQMQVMRQQILGLLTKGNPTVEDKEMLAALQKSFDEKKAEWDTYLVDVAEGRVKKEKVQESFCCDCGAKICDCGKGIDCKKCGKKVCNCSKACSVACSDKATKVEAKKEGKEFHRYNKKYRRHHDKEYHRYNKKHRSDCCTPDYSCGDNCTAQHKHHYKKAKKAYKKADCSACPSKSSCASDKKAKKAVCCTPDYSCGDNCTANHKHNYKKAKKAYKKADCSACPSKSSCASGKKEVKCNGGVDCPSCPNFKTDKCCKVSGKCSSGHDHKEVVKPVAKPKAKKVTCPLCNEYRLMKINKKCAACSK